MSSPRAPRKSKRICFVNPKTETRTKTGTNTGTKTGTKTGNENRNENRDENVTKNCARFHAISIGIHMQKFFVRNSFRFSLFSLRFSFRVSADLSDTRRSRQSKFANSKFTRNPLWEKRTMKCLMSNFASSNFASSSKTQVAVKRT